MLWRKKQQGGLVTSYQLVATTNNATEPNTVLQSVWGEAREGC